MEEVTSGMSFKKEDTILFGGEELGVHCMRSEGSSMEKKNPAPRSAAFGRESEKVAETLGKVWGNWLAFGNPLKTLWNRKPLETIQVTAHHSPVDEIMEMTSPVAIWLLEHKNA